VLFIEEKEWEDDPISSFLSDERDNSTLFTERPDTHEIHGLDGDPSDGNDRNSGTAD
jgi:hypothetical protein